MKIKNYLVALVLSILSFVPLSRPAQAITLPDLIVTQLAFDRMEWRQMPDCEHNACQNLVWKALLEFTLTVQNNGQAPAQIPNGNFESSGVMDLLTHKEDNRLIARIPNWESVPNALAPGAQVRLSGQLYVEDANDFLKLGEEYILCTHITDLPSDNQNWNLLESNTQNNTLCRNFFLNLPPHILPNPKITNLNIPQVVVRNADTSADFQVVYTVQNTTPQVYVSNFGRHVQMSGLGGVREFCNGNIAPGLHGLESKIITCQVHLPPGTPHGIYKVNAIVDSLNVLRESNEGDNSLGGKIQIL